MQQSPHLITDEGTGEGSRQKLQTQGLWDLSLTGHLLPVSLHKAM